MGYKYLEQKESVLVKQKIIAPKVINTDIIKNQFQQERNTKFLNLPIYHLVYVYNWGLKHYDSIKIVENRAKLISKFDKRIATAPSKKKKSRLLIKKNKKLGEFNDEIRNGNRRMQWGEKLTVFDSGKMAFTTTNIKRYLFTQGYFNAEVGATVSYEYRNASISYNIETNKPYVIDSVVTLISDKKLLSLYEANTQISPLKNQKFDQTMITNERDRIYDLVANNGYYDFKKQFILFEIDSTILNQNKLLIRLSIINPPNKDMHKTYHLDTIVFNSEVGTRITRKPKTISYEGITYNQNANNYAEKILNRRIFLEKDSLYSRKNTLETQKQLAYLDIFRLVSINYDTLGGQFKANILTSPLKKFQTSTEVGLSLFEQAQRPGPFFNFNAKNRNLFHRLEIIDLDANVRLQGIPNVNAENNQYTRFQAGAVASLTLPIFYFPLSKKLRNRFNTFNPRTRFSIGVNYEDRFSEYERTTFTTGVGYLWQINNTMQFAIKPFDASYIESNNSPSFSQELEEFEAQGNRSYVSAFRSSFVSAANANFILRTNDYGISNNNSSFLRVFMEYGGIIQTLIGREPFNPDLNIEYYKYYKFNIDYRNNVRIKSGSSIAYRINTGFAYVFGESQALPYEKYFFAGGSNSIRAWSPRRLGPGAYAEYESAEGDNIVVDYQREQPGDIIVESSIEYRRKVIGFLNVAAFLDAGNIWLWKSKTVNSENDGDSNDDGVFQLKTFLQELAIGGGIGLRMDFSFLILRLDGAYKILDPARPVGERFVLDDVNFATPFDRQYFNLNIGIGYPF